jgi:hypothetical protein
MTAGINGKGYPIMIDREVALIIGPFRLVQQPDPTSWVVTENGAPIGMVHLSHKDASMLEYPDEMISYFLDGPWPRGDKPPSLLADALYHYALAAGWRFR